MSQRKSLATCSGELSENLHRLDIELARELCQNICSLFGLVFIVPEDMFSSVKNLEGQFISYSWLRQYFSSKERIVNVTMLI